MVLYQQPRSRLRASDVCAFQSGTDFFQGRHWIGIQISAFPPLGQESSRLEPEASATTQPEATTIDVCTVYVCVYIYMRKLKKTMCATVDSRRKMVW